MSSPSVHQSVFVKPEHGIDAFVRWQVEHADPPYAEVHINIDDFKVCLFVDQASAPQFARALSRLPLALLGSDFGVWCRVQEGE